MHPMIRILHQNIYWKIYVDGQKTIKNSPFGNFAVFIKIQKQNAWMSNYYFNMLSMMCSVASHITRGWLYIPPLYKTTNG